MNSYSPEMYKSHNGNIDNISMTQPDAKMYQSNPNFNHGGPSKSTRILEPLFPNNGNQQMNNASEFESQNMDNAAS